MTARPRAGRIARGRQRLLLPLLVLCLYSASHAQEYVSGQVLVRFKEGAGKAAATAGASVGATPIKSIPSLQLVQMSVDPTIDMAEVIAAFLANPNCEFAEPNYIVYPSATPNDPQYAPHMWGANNTGQTGGTADADIDAPEAWDRTTGSNQTIVGIMDSGIDWDHPDLAANIWSNPGEIAGNGVDDDGNGYVDDVRGWDFVNEDNDPDDNVGHGTHVAGIVGAVGNNGAGVTGVAWTVKMIPLKTLDDTGDIMDAVEAINYVTDLVVNRGIKVKLVNNSWGYDGPSSTPLQSAIAAAEAAGVLFPASAGNSQKDNDIVPRHPCNTDVANVICVASTDHDDKFSTAFSNWGATSVDLAAPGSNILSTWPDGKYEFKNGTSMATPQVSGVAALIWAADPDLPYAEVRDLILNSGDPLADLNGRVITKKRLNAFAALPGPRAVLSSTSLDFGNVPLGLKDHLELTVSNHGNENLTISDIVAATVAPATGAFAHNARARPFVLAPGSSETFTVTFTPDRAQPGTTTGTLTVSHNGTGGSDVAGLTGEGAIPVSVDGINFGRSGGSRPLTLDNPFGAATITITSIAASAFFNHDAPDTPFNIVGGASQTINVSVASGLTGYVTGQLVITHNPTITIFLTAGDPSPRSAADGFSDGFTTTKTAVGVPYGSGYIPIFLALGYGLYILRCRQPS